MTAYAYFISGPGGDKSDAEKDETKEKRKKIRAYAVLNEIEVEHIFAEPKAHQFKPFRKRPRGKKLLELINGDIILIVDKLADVFFSPGQMLNTIELFKKHKIDLHVIETGGRFVFGNSDDITLILIKHFVDSEKKIQQGEKTNDDVKGHRRRGKIPLVLNYKMEN